MADSSTVNETAAAVANGDQQVRNNVTRNESHYKNEQLSSLMKSFEAQNFTMLSCSGKEKNVFCIFHPFFFLYKAG